MLPHLQKKKILNLILAKVCDTGWNKESIQVAAEQSKFSFDEVMTDFDNDIGEIVKFFNRCVDEEMVSGLRRGVKKNIASGVKLRRQFCYACVFFPEIRRHSRTRWLIYPFLRILRCPLIFYIALPIVYGDPSETKVQILIFTRNGFYYQEFIFPLFCFGLRIGLMVFVIPVHLLTGA